MRALSLRLWVVALACGWLLPNHYSPWLSFHTDAWIAAVLLAASMAVILRSRRPLVIHGISLLVILLIGVIWLQFGSGLVQQAGVAWIGSIYLFGFLLAILTGTQWEASEPGQLADALFAAIGIAALLSVSLQLRQWFDLDGLEMWTIGSPASRPHANLGQPNQLGTLLLWGVLAAAWGLERKQIGKWPALLMIVYLLFGVALTGSRSAWLGLIILLAAVWWWRHLWANKRLPWMATGLGLYFIACVVGLGWLQQMSQGVAESSLMDGVTRMNSEIRPLAWATLVNAALQKPWAGYGWGQVAMAQMTVATQHPSLGSVFSYAHNLFLDLVLWFWLPLGGLASVVVIGLFCQQFLAIRSAENAVLLMLLLVIGNHAMLELPLSHGYFLFPVGLVLGALNTRLNAPVLMAGSRWLLVALWAIAATLLTVVVRDYANVVPSYQLLRMEWQGFQIRSPKVVPNVVLLTQWRDYVRMARVEPRAGLGESDLDAMRNGIVLSPNPLIFFKLATSLALNQQPDEARLWLQRMCKSVPLSDCAQVRKVWARQSLKYPEIAAIPWPIKKTDLAP